MVREPTRPPPRMRRGRPRPLSRLPSSPTILPPCRLITTLSAPQGPRQGADCHDRVQLFGARAAVPGSWWSADVQESNAGRRMLVALTDGFRESTESWTDLLRDCRRRGMRAPVLAVGDGALGFWKAVRGVVPRHPRAALLVAQAGQCSCRAAEVGASRCARGAQRIYNAEDIDKARVAIKAFEIDYGAKYPKVVAKIVADADVLLEFYRDTPPSTRSTWRTTRRQRVDARVGRF